MLPTQVQSDMTVYNLHETDTGPKLQPTVLPGIYWDGAYGMTLAQKGVETKDKVFVMIPADVKTKPVRKYIDPEAYKRLSPEKRKKHWTFGKGDKIVNRIVKDSYESVIALEKALGISNVLTVTEDAPKMYGSEQLRHYTVTGR